jgi:hypothetical protein
LDFHFLQVDCQQASKEALLVKKKGNAFHGCGDPQGELLVVPPLLHHVQAKQGDLEESIGFF